MLSFRTTVRDRKDAMAIMRDDAKTTRVGHFLQISRIDALPQLFNVIRVEMGIIDSASFE